MTPGWGAPRAGYQLALAIALADDVGFDEIWETLVADGGETDLLMALGAQARLMARTAATGTGTPFEVPGEAWERIACADVRDFAQAAYTGGSARIPVN